MRDVETLDSDWSARLSALFTDENPLGPLESPTDDRRVLAELYNGSNRIHDEAMRRKPSFILGRKGAGKSALLLGPSAGPADSPDLVLLTDYHLFGQMKRVEDAHARRYGATFVGHSVEIWLALFWHVVIAELGRTSPEGLDNSEKVVIDRYLAGFPGSAVSADRAVAAFVASLANELDRVTRHWTLVELLDGLGPSSESSHGETRRRMQGWLRRHKVHYVIAIDSLEDLHHHAHPLQAVVRGLFRAVGVNSKERKPDFSIRVCFPAENYRHMAELSANPDKDFGRFILMRWSASEIVHIAATRYRLMLRERHPHVHAQLRLDRQVLAVNEAPDLLRRLLPTDGTFANSRGGQEDPLGYVLRHTQLLPRQFLQILERTIVLANEAGHEPLDVPGQIVRDAVSSVETGMVTAIFNAYMADYPQARDLCEMGLQGLPTHFTVDALERHFRQQSVKRVTGTFFHEFLAILIDIGALGGFLDSTERYHQAQFVYTYDDPARRNISTLPTAELCVHPIFSGVFGGPREHQATMLPIYPYGTDTTSDYRYRS